MSKLNVFVSSTCYDLSLLRDQLRKFIEGMGYNPIMSEYGDILYNPRMHTHTSCIKEVENCDILLLIIGGRFGGKAVPDALNIVNFEALENESTSVDALKDKEHLSITQLEVLTAIENSIPVYTFIAKNVSQDCETYNQNVKAKGSDFAGQITYSSIVRQDTAKYIFHFINFIRHRKKDNFIFPFEKFQDIEEKLKLQWASYFQEFLNSERFRREHKRYHFDDINAKEQDAAVEYLVNCGKVKGLWTDKNGKKDLIERYLKQAHTIKIKVTRGTDLFEVLPIGGTSPVVQNPILLNAINNPERLKRLNVQLLIMTPCFKSTHLQNRWKTKNLQKSHKDEFFSSAYKVIDAITQLNRDASKNVRIEYRFYGDLDAKWRYYICNLPGDAEDCLFLSAYTGTTDGDDLDAYQIFREGDQLSQNLYAYMDTYFDEIWARALTLEELESSILLCEGICEENKCTSFERERCMNLYHNQKNDEYPCYIAEIAGKDSLAAVVRFIEGKVKAEEHVRIIPTVGLTGTEYSSKSASEILALYKSSIRSLRSFVAQDETRMEYICFGEVRYLSDFELWNRLNAKYINQLADIFGIVLPCITCHLYLHLLRVPLYWNKKAKAIITGERHYHGDKVKANQHPQTIECYKKIFNSGSEPVEFLQPVLEIENDGDLEDLLKRSMISSDSNDVGCVLKGNTNGFTFNDDRSKTVSHMQRYLDEFVGPIGAYLMPILKNKTELNSALTVDELKELDKKIQELLAEARKHTQDQEAGK